jgi:uncharacterized protein (TIGR02145 family)
MKTIHLFLLPALAFIACAGLQAQVRIGSSTEPATGAILDLNSSVKGGLVLSNVSIADSSKIPTGTNLFPGIIENVNDDTNSDFKGAIVYNTGTTDIPAGIYIWNGVRWIPPSGCDCPAGTVADDECNCYPYASFGAAGTWMTQNLRTKEQTYTINGETKTLQASLAGSTTEPYYTYPRPNGAPDVNIDTAFNAHKDYGLLYNWAAASSRETDAGGEANNEHAQHQGICPSGWHLPSDLEWIQLEEEIALSGADVYSTTGPTSGTGLVSLDYRGGHGQKMKSTTPVNNQDSNGTSHSREHNGFDALLVGYVMSNGTASSYGGFTSFWASSSDYASSAWNRNLRQDFTGMLRGHGNKNYLFSVRCKKN